MKKKILLAAIGIIAITLSGAIIEEYKAMLQIGNEAPNITATVHTGETFQLNDYRGKNNVVIFFYPKDFTAGCTNQSCSFRDNYEEIKQHDAVIVGISFDKPESHSRFASTYQLPYPLISDGDKSISKQYGAVWLFGLLWFPKRVTFVIDKQGVIRSVTHEERNINQHLEDVLAALGKLR